MSGKRGRLGEIAGVASVVLSLLFVGWEIRQNTSVARAQTRVELTSMNNEFLERIVGDPEFAETWRLAWAEPELKGEATEYRIEFRLMQLLRLLENVHLQYQEGLIDREALRSYGFLGFDQLFMPHQRFAPIWEQRRSSFNPAFVEFLESRDY